MKYQFMPMFWGDFFANTLHLTAQELGAYTALIGHAWEHDGNIAVEDLQRVARVSNRNWPKIRPRMSSFFNTSRVLNYWHHERVHAELSRAAEISNKRKQAALQMHGKSFANALHTTPHTTTTTTEKKKEKPLLRVFPSSSQEGANGQDDDVWTPEQRALARKLHKQGADPDEILKAIGKG